MVPVHHATLASLLLLFTVPIGWGQSRYDRLPAQQKIDMISEGRIPAGTQVVFPQQDVNAFVVAKAKEVVPDGLRDPKVEILDGKATGRATVDFVKMRHAQGQDLNWLLSKLLQGEHPVVVTGRVQSSNGLARVDLDRVEIGGSSITGRAVEMLIRAFVAPIYPQAKVGESFELGYNVDRIELKPGLARVVLAGRGPSAPQTGKTQLRAGR
ncbi:MAG: hypothetical protein HY820_00625 [Acidobacteria bacterium]|nr:hypothetical protein [Acidobacteriota bacterium]